MSTVEFSYHHDNFINLSKLNKLVRKQHSSRYTFTQWVVSPEGKAIVKNIANSLNIKPSTKIYEIVNGGLDKGSRCKPELAFEYFKSLPGTLSKLASDSLKSFIKEHPIQKKPSNIEQK